MSSTAPVTQLLRAVAAGDLAAKPALLATVYAELRRLAGGLMQREAANCTVQATMLVHDAWLALLGDQQAVLFERRAHFFGAAAQAMRRLLVDHARAQQAQRRGGDHLRVTFSDLADEGTVASDVRLLALHDALDRFAAVAPSAAHVVELRYFAGMTIEAIAEATGRSAATVKREWTYARAWLHDRISADLS